MRDPIPRVAVLTPPGTGAIATVAVAGPRAWDAIRATFAPASGKPLPDAPTVGRTWVGTLGDEVIVAVKRGGADAVVEVHCHGGRRVVRRVVGRLVDAGCGEVAGGTEFAPPAADPRAVEPLTRATTLRTANVLLDQFHGAFAREVEALLAADDPAFADRIARLAAFAGVGRHLVEPWKVVVAGPPNVGKSSLINALAGFQRSVVAPIAGTTRDAVTVRVAFDGWPVELTDTAGLRDTADPLEADGVGRARRVAAAADLVVWVLDATDPNPVRPPELAGRKLVVANKSDLPAAWEPGDEIRLSAATGAGVADLGRTIAGLLVPRSPAAGDPVPFTPELAAAVERAAAAIAAGNVGAARELLAACQSGG